MDWQTKNNKRRKANKTGVCELGHEKHKTIKVETVQGDMWVYDWSEYDDNGERQGYCSGRDDVSRTIINTGQWGNQEYTLLKTILERGNKNYMLDFGSHIGWYSILAAKMGYKVHAYESDKETADLLLKNAKLHKCEENIVMHNEWVDKTTKPINVKRAELLKIDLEGNDRYAVSATWEMLKDKRINYALIEISPVFNNTYPEMIDAIHDLGYISYDIDMNRFDGNLDFDQSDLIFVTDETWNLGGVWYE